MKNSLVFKITCVALPIIVGLLTPSITFSLVRNILDKWVIEYSYLEFDVAARFGIGGTLWSLMPFLLLSVFLLLFVRSYELREAYYLCIGGTLGIFALMVPSYVWLLYSFHVDERIHPVDMMFHLLVVPIFCVATMVIGVLVGLVASRTVKWFRNKTDSFA